MVVFGGGVVSFGVVLVLCLVLWVEGFMELLVV